MLQCKRKLTCLSESLGVYSVLFDKNIEILDPFARAERIFKKQMCIFY